MSKPPIYLDNHSTTKPDPRVVAAMMPYLTEIYGNAASVSHRFGWDAEEAVEKARAQVAEALRAEPREIVFTAGATEANNLAIKGALPFLRRKGDHIVATAVEHKSVLDVVERLGRETDWKVTIVPCDDTGLVSLDAVQAAVRPETVLVSVMTANNEVGTINPIREIGAFCHGRGIVFHTDATQAVGKIPIDVRADHIDLLSLSAHKLYGPKGMGALYVRRKDPQVRIKPLFDGGGHERGMRSGTPAVPLIVGLGEAVSLAIWEREADADRIRALRDRLETLIRANVLDVTLNGHPTERLAGNLNMSFAYVDGEALMMAMRDIAVSSGAACTSADPEPSHVLRAMGRDDDSARASLRFGLGRFTTAEEIDQAAEFVARGVAALRVHSSAWAASGKIGSDEPHPS